ARARRAGALQRVPHQPGDQLVPPAVDLQGDELHGALPQRATVGWMRMTSMVRLLLPLRCPMSVFSGWPTPCATAERLSWSKPATTRVSPDFRRTRCRKLLVLTSGASMLLPPELMVLMRSSEDRSIAYCSSSSWPSMMCGTRVMEKPVLTVPGVSEVVLPTLAVCEVALAAR